MRGSRGRVGTHRKPPHPPNAPQFPASHVKTYTYYNPRTLSLDFEGLLASLEAADEGSVVLLHACAHNPTGIDPDKDQWRAIAELCVRRKLLPWFDLAYQGFASYVDLRVCGRRGVIEWKKQGRRRAK